MAQLTFSYRTVNFKTLVHKLVFQFSVFIYNKIFLLFLHVFILLQILNLKATNVSKACPYFAGNKKQTR